MTSPVQRSMAECRKRGWTAAVVERWVPTTFPGVDMPGPGFRKDLFGFGDILVLDDERGALMIQACAGSGHAAHVAKALAQEKLSLWLARKNRFQIWSWSKRGARGKRKLWTLRAENFTCHLAFRGRPVAELCLEHEEKGPATERRAEP